MCKSRSGALYIYTQLFILEQMHDYMYCTYLLLRVRMAEGWFAFQDALGCQYTCWANRTYRGHIDGKMGTSGRNHVGHAPC